MPITPAEQQTARVLYRALASKAPQTDDELHTWIHRVLGINLARTCVSDPNATPPFQFIADAFFERQTGLLVLGSRDSGKTLGVAILNLLNSLYKPGCETVSVASLEAQALRAKDYVDGFLRRQWRDVDPVVFADDAPLDPKDKFVFGLDNGDIYRASTATEIEFTNRSKLTIATGTLRAVSGPHPQKAIADEVELWKWPILMKWFGMASQGPTPYKAQWVLTSTRESMTGPMNKLIENLDHYQLQLYYWNVFDSMESCQKRFGGCLCKRGAAVIDPTACPLWDMGCGGICTKASGMKKWEEVVKASQLDAETWETQFLCTRPSKKSLVFPEYDRVIHSGLPEAIDYDPAKGPIYLGIDPGWTGGYAVVLAQLTEHSLDVFDELFVQRTPTRQIQRMLLTGEWPHDGKGWFQRDYFTSGKALRASTPMVTNVAMAVIDNEDPEKRMEWATPLAADDFQYPAWPILGIDKKRIDTRLRAVRQRLRVGPYGPELRIHPRCTNLIWELEVGYRYKVDSETGEVTAEIPIKAHDHACSALGYLAQHLDRPRGSIRVIR